jgi:hypothetical protein
MTRAPLFCLAVLLSACSAEVAVQTEPFTQAVPVTSIGPPVYAEVAIDLPEEAQGTDIVVKEVAADLVVVNPTRNLSLTASARLSRQGQATPAAPVLYSEANKPAYFAESTVLLPPQTYQPGQRVPVVITGPALVEAIGQPRIWLIVSNAVTQVGVGLDTLPVEIRLENIQLRAVVTKDFPGLGGALEVGGL